MRHWRGRSLLDWVLIALLFVLGVRAIAGGAVLVLDPSGATLGLDPASLSGWPFADFLVPGLVLFGVIGVGAIVAKLTLIVAWERAYAAALVVGLALVAWVLVEGAIVGFGERLQIPNLLLALAIVAASAVALRRNRAKADAG